MTKSTSHPAQGPVSLDRLHQICKILSKIVAQSDDGNLGYAVADTVKVIDGTIAAFGAEPAAYAMQGVNLDTDVISTCKNVVDDQVDEWNQERKPDVPEYKTVPLYTAPPAPVVPDEITPLQVSRAYGGEVRGHRDGWNAYRAVMLQTGNSPVTQDDYVLVPKKLTAENGARSVLSGEFSETKLINYPECFGDDDCETCDGSRRIEITVPVTWMTIEAIWARGVEHFAAAPQQENIQREQLNDRPRIHGQKTECHYRLHWYRVLRSAEQ